MALLLQSVTIVDQQAIFTITSTRISGMVMALWLQSVTVIDQQAIFTILSTRISVLSVYDSNRLWPQSYFGGSIRFCESGLSVHNSHKLQAQGYYLFWCKYLCLQRRATFMLLTSVEVSDCWSTTATD